MPDISPSLDSSLLCPNCGYDLRANPTDRCPECGQIIDPAALARSTFPWAHRRHIGRVRAFIKTVWQVSIDSRHLKHEAKKPHNPADARSFNRLIAISFAITLILVFLAAAFFNQGLSFLAIYTHQILGLTDNHPLKLSDLLVPWSAGATLLPLPPIVLTVFAFSFCKAPRLLIPAQDDSSRAIACYSIAPIAFLLPVIILDLVVLYVESVTLMRISLALLLTMILLPTVIVITTLFRVFQWSLRIHDTSLPRLIFNFVRLLLLWLLFAFLWLGLIPWCVGFTWIVIDSFR